MSKFRQKLVALNQIKRAFNYAGGRGKIIVSFNAAKAEEPAEIMVCEMIGEDAWTGEGFTLTDLKTALDEVTPKTRPLNFMVNSPGGYVHEGVAIRNMLSGWKGQINKTIIGVAASAASWCIPADTTKAYKNSQMFIHRSMAFGGGNCKDYRKAADQLETTDLQIADMYAEDSGGEPDSFLELMDKETLLTGQQAKDIGLVDEIIGGEAENQFTPEWINSAKQKLSALNSLRFPGGKEATQQQQPASKPANGGNPGATTNAKPITPPGIISTPMQGVANQQNQPQIMNKTKMLALLNKWGVTVPENATDEQLTALVEAGPKPAVVPPVNTATSNPAPAATVNLADDPVYIAMKNQLAAARRKDIQNVVEKAASEGRITALEIDNWIEKAAGDTDHPTNGNPTLALLNKIEPRAPGVAPLPLANATIENASVKDIGREFQKFNEASASLMRGNEVSMKDIQNAAVAKALFFRKVGNRLVEAMNTNTIDAGLQRQVILQDVVIRDFKRRVMSLDMFSTVFRNVPLQGTNKVEVPYYDLDSSASTDFVTGTGYTTVSNTASAVREITVGEGATNGKRKYQALAFSSQEIARQPYLKVAQLAGLKAEKLAFDIWQDILSIITNANFGAAAFTGSADTFNSDKLADIKAACKAWPMEGRGLIIDSLYDANLLKDPAFKFALNAASDSAIKEGRLYPRVMGFDYNENPNIPANGENLVGFAFWKYAILVAFAPVPPVQEVRNSGTTWELITDPDTGISLEYRAFGNNVTDVATNVIESSYGYAAGLKTGLKRLVSA